MTPPLPPEIADVFAGASARARTCLTKLRDLIFQEAAFLKVGPLRETLKWGQPAYLTEATRSGTTLRLGWSEKHPDDCRLFVHCQTSLVDQWRNRFPNLTFERNRVLIVPLGSPPPRDDIRQCIAMALTYHSMRAS